MEKIPTSEEELREKFADKFRIFAQSVIARPGIVTDSNAAYLEVADNFIALIRDAGSRGIICPFCKEGDFDLIGLKYHYQMGHCEKYNETGEVSIRRIND